MGTFEKVKESLERLVKGNTSTIKLEDSFINDLGLDSLDYIDLIFELEQKFDIYISDEESTKFETINDLVNYIDKG